MTLLRVCFALLVASACSAEVAAQPFIEPGRIELRHHLSVLRDADLLSIPAQGWPISRADLDRALQAADLSDVTLDQTAAVEALRKLPGSSGAWQFSTSAFVGKDPISIRDFEDTPRADAGIGFVAWMSSGRISVNISANALVNPFDDDNFNLDGTYVSADFGNWTASAGWQERWWGPGNNSSLILSTNARPAPGIALQRRHSEAFKSRWLSWIGPWTLTTFMNVLDDDRAIENALLWGARVDFMPTTGLEIGLSRTAQWCGSGRSCGVDTFTDVLLGNDNRGVNVLIEDEPGNQLAGVDIRWRMPRNVPAALYLQWIGEDSRQGGPEIGSWLRLAGAEHWGFIGETSYRLHAEWADTTCREGGAGFSAAIPDCSYRHPIYAGGYIYEGRSLGHSADGDSRALSLGVTLLQSGDNSWNVSLRRMKINQSGTADQRHTISATPAEIADLVMSHNRKLSFGRVQLGVTVQDHSSATSGDSKSFGGFLRWTSR